VTPLTGKITVGEDPFVIVVGEGPDGNTDLFAAPAGGGRFSRLTFNRPVEDHPRLAPNGKAVAFLRRRAAEDSSETLVVLDLTTMNEAEAAVPARARETDRVGWSGDGTRLVVSAGRAYLTASPPARLELRAVPADSQAAADSITLQVLGDPPVGTVRECAVNGAGLCIGANGQETPLGLGVTDALRWGSDSVGYLEGGQLVVRPLGGGRTRVVRLTEVPTHLRRPTYYPGSAALSER
jgi:hypothetical protein